MDMPKLGSEHVALQAFAGDWEGPEVVQPSAWGPGGRADGRMSFREDLNGFALIQEYVQQKDSRVSFRAHGVFMVDPDTREILWYWFDSVGFPPHPPTRGRFDGSVLSLTRMTERGTSRYVFEIKPDSCLFSIANQVPGAAALSPFMSGSYQRKD